MIFLKLSALALLLQVSFAHSMTITAEELAHGLFESLSGATSAQLTRCVSGIPVNQLPSVDPNVDDSEETCLQITFDTEGNLQGARNTFLGQTQFSVGALSIYLGPVSNFAP